MNYENYYELYEAVYLLAYLNNFKEQKVSTLCCKSSAKEKGISQQIYDAMMKILIVNDLVVFKEGSYILNKKQKKKLQEILKHITHKNNSMQYEEFLVRAKRQNQFFFDDLDDLVRMSMKKFTTRS